jgi:hypothetical protein
MDGVGPFLAPLDPAFKVLQDLPFVGQQGIEFQLAGRLFILNLVAFVAIRAIVEYVPLPLPKYKSWNKLSFTHYVWTQIWTLYVAVGMLTFYFGDEINSSTFTYSWQNRMNRPVTGANLYFHAWVVWQLSTVFVIWWFNIDKTFVTGSLTTNFKIY